MPHRFFVVATLLFVCATASAATLGGPLPGPLPLFPQNNWWNTDISSAPVDGNSTTFLNTLGQLPLGPRVHPDFGGNDPDNPGSIFGIPYVIVDSAQPKLSVDFDVPDESDGVTHGPETPFPFYPIPEEAKTMTGWIEGGPPGNVDAGGDRHILIVNKDTNELYEIGNTFFNGTTWQGFSGAYFNMNTNNRRPETWTSADAAGLAILPGLVRYDEVYGPGEIRHAFRVTVSSTANYYVFPASHKAGTSTTSLPLGARLRLKATTNISAHPPEMQKVFRAMMKYGLIVADNGSNMFVSGTYDTRWDNGILNPAFRSLRASDFEVVQLGWKPPVTFILTLPSSVGSADVVSATLTAYDGNYNVATGYTGTVRFTSTDGAATLPLDYTFTGGDAGVHTFPAGFVLRTPGAQIVTFTDTANAMITGSVGVSVGPPTPINVVATATSTTSVSVSWSPSNGATQYEVLRASAGIAYATRTTTPATNFTDSSLVPGTTYLYRVRAMDSSARASQLSAPDAATTILFTDDPVMAGATAVKSLHITEVRTAVNAVRAAAGLGAATFTDGPIIQAIQFQEVRNALTPARAALGLPTITYTDATLTPGSTIIKAVHMQDLRSGAK